MNFSRLFSIAVATDRSAQRIAGLNHFGAFKKRRGRWKSYAYSGGEAGHKKVEPAGDRVLFVDKNLDFEQGGGQQYRGGHIAAAADDKIGLEFAQNEKTFNRAEKNGCQGKKSFQAPDVLRQPPGRYMDKFHGLGQGADNGSFAAFFGANIKELGVGVLFLQCFKDCEIGIDVAAGAAAGEKEFVLFHVGFFRAYYIATYKQIIAKIIGIQDSSVSQTLVLYVLAEPYQCPAMCASIS